MASVALVLAFPCLAHPYRASVAMVLAGGRIPLSAAAHSLPGH
ncbi:MAG TPA: hypothetical protein VGM12_25915 [Trebonia sp.]